MWNNNLLLDHQLHNLLKLRIKTRNPYFSSAICVYTNLLKKFPFLEEEKQSLGIHDISSLGFSCPSFQLQTIQLQVVEKSEVENTRVEAFG